MTNPKRKRLLEWTQFVLSFVSTCAVLETTRVYAPPADRPAYSASIPLAPAAGDRRVADLARAERKRRETDQHASRRSGDLRQSLEQRQLRA